MLLLKSNVMNYIFNLYVHFIIVYIDDVLVYSNSIKQHFKHVIKFHIIAKNNGIVLFKWKMNLVQTKIKYLGHDIKNGYIHPIQCVIEFSSKFFDELKDKTQLKRFLRNLNYILDFYKDLAKDYKLSWKRLKNLSYGLVLIPRLFKILVENLVYFL